MGYEFKTTFWNDFTIADAFGVGAVKDTFKRAFNEWCDDAVYVTELAIVTNWKCWQHWERGNRELEELYSDMYYKVRDWAIENLEGEELEYYWRMTD